MPRTILRCVQRFYNFTQTCKGASRQHATDGARDGFGLCLGHLCGLPRGLADRPDQWSPRPVKPGIDLALFNSQDRGLVDVSRLGELRARKTSRLAGRLEGSGIKRVDHGNYISAYVQLCQRHMCSVIGACLHCYDASMQPEQVVIADWIKRTQARLDLSYSKWATAAGLGAATTVTRAIDPEYGSITSIKTLNILAKAAGVPSVLDFLASDEASTKREPVIPSEETLASLLAAVLPLAGRGPLAARSLRVVSAALAHGLELLGDQSANPDNAGAVGAAARGAVLRFRELSQQ